ncbi:hypothetical protein Glove_29g180 [Diversispora epigaea]|uniref:Uncharacterized protein n=1 Tax=Diversispora epigaea TaxID=1348612 RepID=A0A397JRW2_9GLOM|nr:hypothetical protein Glove_29g180 [Diversispora epigaea]
MTKNLDGSQLAQHRTKCKVTAINNEQYGINLDDNTPDILYININYLKRCCIESTIKLASITDTTSKIELSSFSNPGDSKEISIKSASNGSTFKTILLTFSDPEVDSTLSSANNTEKESNNINSTQKESSIESASITKVDNKINALSNIINNFNSIQKEPSHGDCEESKNEINEIFDEILNCREQRQQKNSINVNESNFYYSKEWNSEKKYR